jgi:hypothetical protein
MAVPKKKGCWHIFSINRQHFEDFPILSAAENGLFTCPWFTPSFFFSLLLALSVLTLEVTLKEPLALIFSGITAGIIYHLIENTP